MAPRISSRYSLSWFWVRAVAEEMPPRSPPIFDKFHIWAVMSRVRLPTCSLSGSRCFGFPHARREKNKEEEKTQIKRKLFFMSLLLEILSCVLSTKGYILERNVHCLHFFVFISCHIFFLSMLGVPFFFGTAKKGLSFGEKTTTGERTNFQSWTNKLVFEEKFSRQATFLRWTRGSRQTHNLYD